MHTSVHIHVDARRRHLPYLRQGLLLKLEVHQLARLDGQSAQGYVCLLSTGLGSQWGSYVDAGTQTQFFKLLQQALSRPHF